MNGVSDLFLQQTLFELAEARGVDEKLRAAARILAHTGLINDTPQAKQDWREDRADASFAQF